MAGGLDGRKGGIVGGGAGPEDSDEPYRWVDEVISAVDDRFVERRPVRKRCSARKQHAGAQRPPKDSIFHPPPLPFPNRRKISRRAADCLPLKVLTPSGDVAQRQTVMNILEDKK